MEVGASEGQMLLMQGRWFRASNIHKSTEARAPIKAAIPLVLQRREGNVKKWRLILKLEKSMGIFKISDGFNFDTWCLSIGWIHCWHEQIRNFPHSNKVKNLSLSCDWKSKYWHQRAATDWIKWEEEESAIQSLTVQLFIPTAYNQ